MDRNPKRAGKACGVVCHKPKCFAVRNQSGTFSGTFVPFRSPTKRYDPLAFQPEGQFALDGKVQKALVYWAFIMRPDGGPSRTRTCNPRSRNPLSVPISQE